MPKRKPRTFTLSGTVYCDWNAFSFVAPLPDARYWAPGDLVIWSWSGNSKKPSSCSHDGLFAVSVIVGVRKLRRAKFKVKRTRAHRNLAFLSDYGREKQLAELVKQLRALEGRKIIKSRFGFEVLPYEEAPVEPGIPTRAAPTFPPTSKPGERRGRIKPGIRSVDGEATGTARFQRAPVTTPPTNNPRKRKRKRYIDPRQADLFPDHSEKGA